MRGCGLMGVQPDMVASVEEGEMVVDGGCLERGR